jgi:hypothetical protein
MTLRGAVNLEAGTVPSSSSQGRVQSESEDFSRSILYVPGRQDEVISRVGKADPNTVVVLQASSSELYRHPPVTLSTN